jgi:DNA-binding protein YbaB
MEDFEAAAEQALAHYRELRRDAMNIQQQIKEISATAVSKRQTVKVTVNVHGEISALEFPTGGYKRMTPTELAEAIKTTAQEAKAKALDDLNALMEPKLQTGLSFKDLIQGKADLAAALPEEPAMPDAVADYLRRGRPDSAPVNGGASS